MVQGFRFGLRTFPFPLPLFQESLLEFDTMPAILGRVGGQFPADWLIRRTERFTNDLALLFDLLITVEAGFEQTRDRADVRLRTWLDTDQLHGFHDRLPTVVVGHHAVDLDHRRQRFDVVAAHFADDRHPAIRVMHAVKAVSLDDDIGEDAVNPAPHLRAEARHHAVDHDHRGHAEHHADDAG